MIPFRKTFWQARINFYCYDRIYYLVIGVVLTIKAAIEIWNLNVDPVKKIVVIVLLVLTSWIGIAVYYLVAKDKLATWLK